MHGTDRALRDDDSDNRSNESAHHACSDHNSLRGSHSIQECSAGFRLSIS